MPAQNECRYLVPFCDADAIEIPRRCWGHRIELGAACLQPAYRRYCEGVRWRVVPSCSRLSFMPPRSALVATALLVLLLALAPAAGATRPPLAPSMPAASSRLSPLQLARAGRKQTASCSAHREHAGSLERKLLPVACEQPPRSQLKIDVLKHAAANAAAALSGP